MFSRLTSQKRKLRMQLKQSNDDIAEVAEHPNGNTICIDKTKEVVEMVQMLTNENVDEIDDEDDVCLIEDSPVKVELNGKYESDDQKIIEQDVKIEPMEEDDHLNYIKTESVDKGYASVVISTEEIQTNGNDEGESSVINTNETPEESITSVSAVVSKTTDSNPQETVPMPTIEDLPEESNEAVNKTKPNYKRPRSATQADDAQPTKRLKTELEQGFISHNKRVQDYIDKTLNNSVDEINNHIENLIAEVDQLQSMATIKEQEWNNILYLKKVKEEIIYRLSRRKTVIQINSTKIGEMEDYTILEQQPSVCQKITKENRNSLLLKNDSRNSTPYAPLPSTAATSSIIQNIATMKTSDLAREKNSVAKMHR